MSSYLSRIKKKAADAKRAAKTKIANTGVSANSIGQYISESTESAGSVIRESARKSEKAVRTIIEHEHTRRIIGVKKAGIDKSNASIERVADKVARKGQETEEPPPETEEERHTQAAIEKLEGRDKVGQAAEVLSAAGGTAAGAAAAGTIATAVGATTLLGSTTLASALGGIFVTTTPVGWVIGCAVVAGTAGYGLSRMIRSGGKQDEVRKQIIERLDKRIQKLRVGKQQSLVELDQLMTLAIASELISETKARQMIDLIEKRRLDPDMTVVRMKALLMSEGIIQEASADQMS